MIKLPCLVPDPISVKLDSHTLSLDSLTSKVQNLPSLLSAPPTDNIAKCCFSMDQLLGDIKVQLDKLSSFANSFSQVTDKLSRASHSFDSNPAAKLNSVQVSQTVAPSSLCSRDRSNNIILFELPETFLLNMKSAIDAMSTHLIQKSVYVTDAFRLGRKGDLSSLSRPHPILIKLESCWDKRLLLASCRKLKGYSDYKLYP